MTARSYQDESWFDSEFFLGSERKGHVRNAPSEMYEIVAKTFSELYSGKSIVEVGCGLGPFVKAFLEQGIDAQGFDISPWAIENTRCSDKSRVQIGDVKKFVLSADIVFVWNVLAFLQEWEVRELVIPNLISAFRYRLIVRVECVEILEYHPTAQKGRQIFRTYSWWRSLFESYGLKMEEEELRQIHASLHDPLVPDQQIMMVWSKLC